MSYFFWATTALFLATVIYYVVFAGLVYYWHEKTTTLVIVPLIYTFEFFVIASMATVVFSLAAEYLPELLKLL